jgi:nitrogen fixation protein NifU and related proteins
MNAADATDAKLRALYQEVILDHYRRPRNVGVPERAHVTVSRSNPTCGDEIRLYLSLEEGQIADARFEGRGCSISQASASMMTELVRGRSAEEAHALLARFREMLHGDVAASSDARLGQIRALSGVARVPARIGCAMLPWVALQEAVR